MIKNRTAQLIFQVVYCTLAIFGIIGSLGYFDGEFNVNFYVYYTNLSNYICMGMMFASLIYTIKAINRKEDGYVNIYPTFKFLCVIMILVTFFVYNILLAKDKSASEYFLSPSNLIMHLILPIMFTVDWFLFYEHKKVKWYFPLLSTIMPLVYVVFILIRASFIGGGEGILLYPYFFLNVAKLGWGGFFMWISILLVIFIALGYLLYVIDKFVPFEKNMRKNTTSKIEDKKNKN